MFPIVTNDMRIAAVPLFIQNKQKNFNLNEFEKNNRFLSTERRVLQIEFLAFERAYNSFSILYIYINSNYHMNQYWLRQASNDAELIIF